VMRAQELQCGGGACMCVHANSCTAICIACMQIAAQLPNRTSDDFNKFPDFFSVIG
jgi:hypothetical protein